jgi:hypothetical protein
MMNIRKINFTGCKSGKPVIQYVDIINVTGFKEIIVDRSKESIFMAIGSSGNNIKQGYDNRSKGNT